MGRETLLAGARNWSVKKEQFRIDVTSEGGDLGFIQFQFRFYLVGVLGPASVATTSSTQEAAKRASIHTIMSHWFIKVTTKPVNEPKNVAYCTFEVIHVA